MRTRGLLVAFVGLSTLALGASACGSSETPPAPPSQPIAPMPAPVDTLFGTTTAATPPSAAPSAPTPAP